MKTVEPQKFKRCMFIILLSFITWSSEAQKRTEILWDNYGVPHIYGETLKDMYYAFGWSQMHNHANLMLKLYGQARGRAAEYWGEKFLLSDKQVHLFNLPESAKQHYASQDKDYKPLLDAFVKGVNAYANANPQAIDSTMKRVLPITATDVLSHTTRVTCLEFLASNEIRNTIRLLAPGSNAYAIAPSKSASKNAMLLSNPHLPWADLYTFFEAHLNAPGFNAYGAVLVGQPALNIAFNNQLGWTHTVNTIDAVDRYELILKGSGYLLDSTVVPFEKKTVSLKVRQPDGSIKITDVQLSYSKHGPVVGEKAGKAYAVRIAGLENANVGSQYHKMAIAKNWKEFESALKMLQNPMFNIVYADHAGNILYLFNGNVPKRKEGDWNFWNTTIDGTTSNYIWNSYHTYNELPKVFNPASGFVQNANDAPWTSTFPQTLMPANFPPYMAPQVMALRPQRAAKMIKDDRSITFEELVQYKMNTGIEAADRFLDDLETAVQQYPDTIARRAMSVLKQWDKLTNADSKGAVLFTRWYDMLNESMFSKRWDPSQPLTTPDGLNNPQQAVGFLIKAATETEKAYGRLDIPWGEVNRFHIGTYDLPGNGGSSNAGVFRSFNFAKSPSGKNSYANQGDTYVAITEFGKKVKAQVLLSYGNASQPGNKHIGDQLPLLSEKKLRPALLDKKEILSNLEEQEFLDPASEKQSVKVDNKNVNQAQGELPSVNTIDTAKDIVIIDSSKTAKVAAQVVKLYNTGAIEKLYDLLTDEKKATSNFDVFKESMNRAMSAISELKDFTFQNFENNAVVYKAWTNKEKIFALLTIDDKYKIKAFSVKRL